MFIRQEFTKVNKDTKMLSQAVDNSTFDVALVFDGTSAKMLPASTGDKPHAWLTAPAGVHAAESMVSVAFVDDGVIASIRLNNTSPLAGDRLAVGSSGFVVVDNAVVGANYEVGVVNEDSGQSETAVTLVSRQNN